MPERKIIMYENVVFFRNLFYKGFFIGLLYYILLTLGYLFNKGFFVDIMTKYYVIEAKDAYILCGYYLGAIEVILGMLFLIPALTLHCASCRLKGCCKMPKSK